MNFHLRPGTPTDAQACGQICYDAFATISKQHNFPPDFPAPEMAQHLMTVIFSLPHIYSVVAEQNGRIVGSNFLWEGDTIAGLGPITVEPEVQNGSIGRRLMENVLARAAEKKFAGVRLVQAGYHGRSLSLYTKLGFEVREPLAVMQGPALKTAIPGFTVREAARGDFEACNALCTRVHGHDRRTELEGAIERNVARVVERNQRITGYATDIGFFTHAVAESNDDLKALIAAAPEFSGPGFLLPSRNSELFRWCLERGLRVVQPLNLMSLGLYNEPKGAFLPSILF
jgi:predicted N-acetyltransferase YhbS